ncbi:MAG: hypothetical protein KGI41_01060 [Patescibacteria group bacterium]|nr:hypothetical protein [Patescibacteria group bacterium]
MPRRLTTRELKDIALAIVLTLACLWFAWLIWGLWGKEETARTAAGAMHAQLTDLESRSATIQTDLSALETPRGRDAAIRTAFGVAKPGEEVIIVVPPAASTSTPTESWWTRLWSWL